MNSNPDNPHFIVDREGNVLNFLDIYPIVLSAVQNASSSAKIEFCDTTINLSKMSKNCLIKAHAYLILLSIFSFVMYIQIMKKKAKQIQDHV